MPNPPQPFKRFNPPISKGLTNKQIQTRIEQGLVNIDYTVKTKSVTQIIRDNLFTLFNFINLILALAVLCVGSYKNLLFILVVFCNAIIGIIQEIRAKKAVEKLNLISETTVDCIRNFQNIKIKIEEIVLDDIIKYSSGNQIAADCVIIDGFCEVNESLLTGEPNLIRKNAGDMLLSGSYIASGQCKVKTENVGENNYSSKILHGVKNIKSTDSEIMRTTKKIIKWISIVIFPVGILLFRHQLLLHGNTINEVIISTAAALIGMIPEGLMLLISTVLAVGVLRLSKKKVLVQDLYCIETLARVDTLCLDKTGTLTEGSFEIAKVIPSENVSSEKIFSAVKLLVSSLNDSNETFNALNEKFNPTRKTIIADEIIPFSSDKKWSGAFFKKEGSYVIGAGEFVFKENFTDIQEIIEKFSGEFRVLVLAHSKNKFENHALPRELNFLGLILLKDKIRLNAEKTLKFFAGQNVDIKIISGDNAFTVSKIAKNLKLKNSNLYIDATKLKTEEDFKNAAKKYTIFGRVTPLQKQKLIKTLKKTGHTVAMVGDGVNDVLALKEADCSVAIANSCETARNISQLVLLNSDFAVLLKVIDEGRRSINNIKRSSTLFLTKTIYSILLAVLFVFVAAPLPFKPVQMSLISTLTIGIPSFFLALEPNREKVKGNIFGNILKISLPSALIIVFNIIICILLFVIFDISKEVYSSLAVIFTGIGGFWTLYKISLPFNLMRKILFCGLIGIFVAIIIFFNNFFSVHLFGI